MAAKRGLVTFIGFAHYVGAHHYGGIMFLVFAGGFNKNFIPCRAEHGRCSRYFGRLLSGYGFSFILPNYPTLLAAVELDDTGSTKLGRHIIDHPFLLPGLASVLLSILFAAGLALIIR